MEHVFSAKIEKKEEGIVITRDVFNEAEKMFQRKANRREFAQKVGEAKIEDRIAPSYQTFLEDRPVVYVCSMDPQTKNVWCTPIFAKIKQNFGDGNDKEEEEEFSDRMKNMKLGHKIEPVKKNGFDPCCPASIVSTVPLERDKLEPLVELESSKIIKILNGPAKNDPLWKNKDNIGGYISLCFIEFETRKRFRINGVLESQITKDGFSLRVFEALPICPRYIQQRKIINITVPPDLSEEIEIHKGSKLSPEMIQFITSSDTFIIGTVHPDFGADCSHRGGHRGFVRVIDEKILVFGDYPGKGMFQTISNTVGHPKTGFLFIDFEGSGKTLQVTGDMKIEWTDKGKSPDGTSRTCILEVDEWIYRERGCPFQWKLLQLSPWSPDLQDTSLLKKLFSKRNCVSKIDLYREQDEKQELMAELIEIEDEVPNIKRFTWKIPSKIKWEPGQYAVFTFEFDSLQYIRAWTISNISTYDPKDESTFLEITAKRNLNGITTNFLHDHGKVGYKTQLNGIEGLFTLEASRKVWKNLKTPKWKIAMITGGIGCTPMISILRSIKSMRDQDKENIESLPDIIYLHANTITFNIPFKEELELYSTMDPPICKLAFALSRENSVSKDWFPNTEIHFGYLNKPFLEKVIPDLRERAVYLCGPMGFMNTVEQILEESGFPEENILSETFEY